MAIFDCFQYFNEDHMVDLRMNILNEEVDYFVISESIKLIKEMIRNLILILKILKNLNIKLFT